jgi:xanthine dehydrogenase accessory factor
MTAPLETAEQWFSKGRKLALASVIETWGSAPRPTGSQLVIDANGNFEGSVSGGCVEGAVVSEAIEIIESGKSRILEFGVADETAWQVGLSCGGRIRVYVEPIDEAMAKTITALNLAQRERRAAMIVSDLESGFQELLLEGGAGATAEVADEAKRRFRSGKSGIAEIKGREVFFNAHIPAPRLVIIGAVHISQALAPMSMLAGFDTMIIDPRTAFATRERFPGIALQAEWPEEVLKTLPLDAFTALAALTHDPKIDDYPLIAALQSRSFYVGALGSRKTHAKRVERLVAAGLSPEEIANIRAPIGLNIAAANPAEIAVAVMGEVIEAFRKRGDSDGDAA